MIALFKVMINDFKDRLIRMTRACIMICCDTRSLHVMWSALVYCCWVRRYLWMDVFAVGLLTEVITMCVASFVVRIIFVCYCISWLFLMLSLALFSDQFIQFISMTWVSFQEKYFANLFLQLFLNFKSICQWIPVRDDEWSSRIFNYFKEFSCVKKSRDEIGRERKNS